MSPEGPTLVVLETVRHAEAWLAADSKTQKPVVVALSAAVDDVLDRAGIDHLTIEDFYSEAELVLRSANNNVVIEALCSAIDTLLEVRIGAELPTFSAHYYAGRLRVLYDGFQRAAFCLGSLLDCQKPQRIVLGGGSEVDASEIWLRMPDFLSRVLAELCSQRGISIEIINSAKVQKAGHLSPLQYLITAGRKIRDELRYRWPGRGDIAYVLWPEIPEAALARVGLTAVRLPARVSKERPGTFSTISLIGLDHFFKFDAGPLFRLAEPSLRAFVEAFRAQHLRQLQRTEQFFRRTRVQACVALAPLGLETVTAILAARRLNIPAVVLQHGGFNGYAEWSMLPFTDFNLNDFYLSFGSGVAKGLNGLANRINAVRSKRVSTIVVGSASIYSIRKCRPKTVRSSNRLRAIYVPTFLTGSTRYLGGHHRPDVAYWRQQKHVLSLLLGRRDWDVEFRPAPPNTVENPILPWLQRQEEGQAIRLRKDEESFAAILRKERFDLIITDAVTTILLEALATDAAVVTQFDGTVMKLHADAEDLLRRRAAVSFTEADFLADIASALDGVRPAGPLNDEFLHQYAIEGHDGDPSVLTVDALKNIVGGQCRAV